MDTESLNCQLKQAACVDAAVSSLSETVLIHSPATAIKPQFASFQNKKPPFFVFNNEKLGKGIRISFASKMFGWVSEKTIAHIMKKLGLNSRIVRNTKMCLISSSRRRLPIKSGWWRISTYVQTCEG